MEESRWVVYVLVSELYGYLITTVACIETRGLGNLPYKPGISN